MEYKFNDYHLNHLILIIIKNENFYIKTDYIYINIKLPNV